MRKSKDQRRPEGAEGTLLRTIHAHDDRIADSSGIETMTRVLFTFVFGIALLVSLQSCDTAGSSEQSTTVKYKVKVDSIGERLNRSPPEDWGSDDSLWYSVKFFDDENGDGGINIGSFEELVDSTTTTVGDYIVTDTIEVDPNSVTMVCVYGWVPYERVFRGSIRVIGPGDYLEGSFYRWGEFSYLPSSEDRGEICVSL